ncbi:ribonuclease HI [Arthrobacter silviterrae]|uniref:ribonuclease H n=1 Tax=Arthrobacter silviterrae TaxID=2026658 RepID=A0ABX0DAY6_9MICC|nr:MULTISPECIES: ribonuclease HI family protein [Arthrobacter]MCU6480858.1 ribonuclease HI family protein [Arthrobacter sp. A2-55]MDQ0278949.1 ribonuclease HI [Arthrobacter silviterrae]NGN84052.1 ribonuclease HI family protein [Arthrobacter silviterrae]
MTIVAAADGSALGNPGPAGWAWYVNDDCWRAGGWPHGTNNMGELMAVLDLFLSTAHVPQEPLHILCDSQYVINCVTKWMPGWKRKGWRKSDGKPVLNVDLLKQIDAAIVGRNFTFEWVKGHAGHDLNEAADDRARDAATAYQGRRAPDEGPGFPGAASGGPQAPAPALVQADVPPVTAAAAPAAGPAEAVAQLDLFSSLDDEPDPAFAPSPDGGLGILVELERELMDPEVRADPTRVGRLLHRDFVEFGASGRSWSREDLIVSLAEEDGSPATLDVLTLDSVDTDTALLTYRCVGLHGTSLRSSLWRRDNGRWQLRFHQGTREA